MSLLFSGTDLQYHLEIAIERVVDYLKTLGSQLQTYYAVGALLQEQLDSQRCNLLGFGNTLGRMKILQLWKVLAEFQLDSCHKVPLYKDSACIMLLNF